MSFNVPIETKYSFVFEEVLTHEQFFVSEVGTSLRDASLRAYRKLVETNPRQYYILRSVDYPERDYTRDRYMDQMNAAGRTKADYSALQNYRRHT